MSPDILQDNQMVPEFDEVHGRRAKDLISHWGDGGGESSSSTGLIGLELFRIEWLESIIGEFFNMTCDFPQTRDVFAKERSYGDHEEVNLERVLFALYGVHIGKDQLMRKVVTGTDQKKKELLVPSVFKDLSSVKNQSALVMLDGDFKRRDFLFRRDGKEKKEKLFLYGQEWRNYMAENKIVQNSVIRISVDKEEGFHITSSPEVLDLKGKGKVEFGNEVLDLKGKGKVEFGNEDEKEDVAGKMPSNSSKEGERKERRTLAAGEHREGKELEFATPLKKRKYMKDATGSGTSYTSHDP